MQDEASFRPYPKDRRRATAQDLGRVLISDAVKKGDIYTTVVFDYDSVAINGGDARRTRISEHVCSRPRRAGGVTVGFPHGSTAIGRPMANVIGQIFPTIED